MIRVQNVGSDFKKGAMIQDDKRYLDADKLVTFKLNSEFQSRLLYDLARISALCPTILV